MKHRDKTFFASVRHDKKGDANVPYGNKVKFANGCVRVCQVFARRRGVCRGTCSREIALGVKLHRDDETRLRHDSHPYGTME